MSRGYFGIGVFEPKFEENIGTLFRHAQNYGADFIFTIGKRYKRQPTDTPDTSRHTPLYHYENMDDFLSHLPKGAEVVCVEQTTGSTMLPDFEHPERAVYLLGSEDHGLPQSVLETYPTVEIPSLKVQSQNVAVSGTVVMYDRFTSRQAIDASSVAEGHPSNGGKDNE